MTLSKGEYYATLARSSEGWVENRWTYMPFVRYFLRTLLECYIDMDTRLPAVNGRKMNKGERTEAMMKNSLAPMSKRQMCVALPDISSRAMDVAVAWLQREGKVEKVGSYRDAMYRWLRRFPGMVPVLPMAGLYPYIPPKH